MKRYLAFLLALVLCFGLCACGGSGEETPPEPQPTEPDEIKVEDDGIMKILLTAAAWAWTLPLCSPMSAATRAWRTW